MAEPKHPETARLAAEAYEASGCKTHEAFVEQFGDAIGLRTFRSWLAGSYPMSGPADLLIREYIDGWRPKRRAAK